MHADSNPLIQDSCLQQNGLDEN
jgi:hypothetical protein